MSKRGHGPKRLDSLDCKLINLLQRDGRMSNKALAKALGTSDFTARTRLNRLINEKIIRIVAVSNPLDMGFELTGNIKIKINLKDAERILGELKKIDALIWVALTTGGTDVDADFVVRTREEFRDLIFKKISLIDGVISLETSMMVELVKDTHDWGTAYDDEEDPAPDRRNK